MNLLVRPRSVLAGALSVPGDKSVSHRALLLGSVASGLTEIHGLLEGQDCLATSRAVSALGAEVTRKGPGHYVVRGAGLSGLTEPEDVIDCGNSGTTARLLLGLCAGQPFSVTLTGDASLRRRPMERVLEPLRRMGVRVVGRGGDRRLPVTVAGRRPLAAIHHVSPVASAQVKSAVLLAGIQADGPTSVTEPAVSRDHSERMLQAFGADVSVEGTTVTVRPGRALEARAISVPGDISSAAFFLVAAALAEDGEVRVEGVGVNPTRTGLLDALAAMGADVERRGFADDGEPVADLVVRPARLRGTAIGGALVPRVIDELPVLAVAAAAAEGPTEVRDAAELRVKESDRIAALASELSRMGVRIEERPDGFRIEGRGRRGAFRGARVRSFGDHRLAMALVVAGLHADGPTLVEDADCIATSFPEFVTACRRLAGDDAIEVQ